MRDRDDYTSAGGPATRRGYAERRRSVKAFVTPVDFGRSRRVGLSRWVCARCGAIRGESLCTHNKSCPGLQGFIQQRTGPLGPDETSRDSGWYAGR